MLDDVYALGGTLALVGSPCQREARQAAFNCAPAGGSLVSVRAGVSGVHGLAGAIARRGAPRAGELGSAVAVAAGGDAAGSRAVADPPGARQHRRRAVS